MGKYRFGTANYDSKNNCGINHRICNYIEPAQKSGHLIMIFILLPVLKNRQNSKERRDTQAPSFSSGTERTVHVSYFHAEEGVMKCTLKKKI
jgi:hypothetical protein